MQIDQLATKAKQGDLEAFEQLYYGLSQRIFCYIRMKIQNRQDAEDVLQEVFIKSYKGLGSLRPGKLNFSAWIYKITGNTINDYFRKKYRSPEVVNIDEGFDLPDSHSLFNEIMAESDLATAQAKLGHLPALHRKVLELRFFGQLSVTEVAKALNKSNLAIRMLQYRARKKLKSVLEKTTGQISINNQTFKSVY